MKGVRFPVILALAALTAMMCGGPAEQVEEEPAPAAEPEAAPAEQTRMPAADGQEFWTYITETNDYKQWPPWPGNEEMYPGQSPHGAFLRLYVNEPALQAIRNNEAMPNGAIIIKENYGKEKELLGLTPMYKTEGFNPDAGDYFWANYGPKGEVQAAGRVESCIECHRKAEGNDWLFSNDPKKQ